MLRSGGFFASFSNSFHENKKSQRFVAGLGQQTFGGVIAEAGLAQFEVVAKDGKVVVPVTNHGAAIDTAGAKGKLTVLAGTAKSEIALSPAGGNRLEGSGNVAGGAKLLISVELPKQKPLQARAVAR